MMPRKTRYARTVKRGDKPLIVCTRETGIFDVAYELNKCPKSWKTERGRAVDRTSQEGARRPFFRAGIALRKGGNTEANQARIKHHVETEANWAMVSVTGRLNALRIDFDEVFVRAEVMYQMIQSV